MPSRLDQLFPPAPPANIRPRRRTATGAVVDASIRCVNGKSSREEISTKWAGIFALEIRGATHDVIAEAVNLTPTRVSQVIRDPRYLAYREERLAGMDAEFVEMKPLAFAALRNGLTARDENTALRASEQWFKTAGYGAHGKQEAASPLTAEDVAASLLNQVNIQVNVNVDK